MQTSQLGRVRAGILVLAAALVLAAVPPAFAQTVISQAGWTATADSEDTCCGGQYLAAKAIDGNASTFWHTVWSSGSPAPPHEIVINLGASHNINGLRYLPRQDGVPNGRIAQYEIYVSTDGSTWGSAVATGTFPNVASQTEVSFPPKVGSYVRLRALTEVEGRPYTSAAEINVLEVTPVTPPASSGYFGLGSVYVKRGAAGSTDLWAAYSTSLNTAFATNPFATVGDTAGGTFRFSCNDSTHLRCDLSVAAAAIGPAGGQVFVYPRVLIHRQDFQGSQVDSYCEYGDGSVGAGPVPINIQTPATPTPTPNFIPINIGGTADCPGTPAPGTVGDVTTIAVGPGRYDVYVSWVFKRVGPG